MCLQKAPLTPPPQRVSSSSHARRHPSQRRLQKRPGIAPLLAHDVFRHARGDDFAAAAFGAKIDSPVGAAALITPSQPPSIRIGVHTLKLQQCRRAAKRAGQFRVSECRQERPVFSVGELNGDLRRIFAFADKLGQLSRSAHTYPLPACRFDLLFSTPPRSWDLVWIPAD